MVDSSLDGLWNATTGKRLGQPDRLRGWAALAWGWIARRPPADVVLVLAPCSRIHTFGVPVSIDVVHCDCDGTVLCLYTLMPNRIGPRVSGTRSIWESRAGFLTELASVGDRLERGLGRNGI